MPRESYVTKKGRVLTDEDIERLADEAERGYDLSKSKREAVGRPSLTAVGIVSPSLHFRIGADLHKRAVRRAKREGKTVSQLAREALERHLL